MRNLLPSIADRERRLARDIAGTMLAVITTTVLLIGFGV
jgi:hypothetical protein